MSPDVSESVIMKSCRSKSLDTKPSRVKDGAETVKRSSSVSSLNRKTGSVPLTEASDESKQEDSELAKQRAQGAIPKRRVGVVMRPYSHRTHHRQGMWLCSFPYVCCALL